MFTAHKTYEGLLISLLEDGPQNIVGYGFLTSDERGHLFFTKELDGATRETCHF
jgi:hypothetical protein